VLRSFIPAPQRSPGGGHSAPVELQRAMLAVGPRKTVLTIRTYSSPATDRLDEWEWSTGSLSAGLLDEAQATCETLLGIALLEVVGEQGQLF
jgi:predicted phage gp36 major capsid-like protein